MNSQIRDAEFRRYRAYEEIVVSYSISIDINISLEINIFFINIDITSFYRFSIFNWQSHIIHIWQIQGTEYESFGQDKSMHWSDLDSIEIICHFPPKKKG